MKQVVTNFFLFLSFFFLTQSCSVKKDQTSTSTSTTTTTIPTSQTETTDENEVETTSTTETPKDNMDQGPSKVELLAKGTKFPDGVAFKGEFKEGAKWTDRNGEHYIIISQYTEGEFFSPSWKSEFYASEYLIKDGKATLAWDIKDFAQKHFQDVAYFPQTLVVEDVDNDGLMESCFFYNIDQDGLDPMNVKMMLHTKGEKLAIRGKLPKTEADFDERYEKNVDPAFAKHHNLLKDYANEKWDAFVAEYKKDLM